MSNKNISSKLAAYSRNIDALPSVTKSWTEHLNSWSIYTVAGGSTLALATAASAGIIYSGTQNISITPNGNAPIDIGTGAGLNLFANTKSFGQSGFSSPNSLEQLRTSRGYLNNLAPGAAISSAMGAGTRWGAGTRLAVQRAPFGAPDGNFPVSSSGFAAVRLLDPAGTHFGWVRLHVESNGITAIDWAYNDVAGESILAGQTAAAVPEPATLPMAILAAGSAGVLAWRKRRREAAAAAPETTAV